MQKVNKMLRKQIVMSILAGILFFVIAFLRPARYEAETIFFVPLTLLEKQIEQNGIGFGSPIEVDAHLELMNSQSLKSALISRHGADFSLEISKTRNGAVQVRAEAGDPKVAAYIANGAVQAADSIKQRMLRQNVGMSFDVIQGRTLSLKKEEQVLRQGLDSLRIEAQTDSLALAALVFRKERQYGSVVVELTKNERKLEDLKEYLYAPAPASYVISEALETPKRAGTPAWAIGLLFGLVVFIFQRAVSSGILVSKQN